MNFFRSRRTPLNIRIRTLAEILEFPVDPKARVQEVFEKVCNAISVRETWFFGLAAEVANDELVWLKSDKARFQSMKALSLKICFKNFFVIFFLLYNYKIQGTR